MKRNKFPPDLYNSFMVRNAEFTNTDIPICHTKIQTIPRKIITYQEAKKSNEYDSFVCFYKHDIIFDGKRNSIWDYPYKSLNTIMKFKGIITPDFSCYRDLPKPFIYLNVYKTRAYGCFAKFFGLDVINNVRFSSHEDMNFLLDGVDKNSIICISSYSALNDLEEREEFLLGFDKMYSVLTPKIILFYGKCPEEIKVKYADKIEIYEYETEFSRKRKKHE